MVDVFLIYEVWWYLSISLSSQSRGDVVTFCIPLYFTLNFGARDSECSSSNGKPALDSDLIIYSITAVAYKLPWAGPTGGR
jgi:hypothetical protein